VVRDLGTEKLHHFEGLERRGGRGCSSTYSLPQYPASPTNIVHRGGQSCANPCHLRWGQLLALLSQAVLGFLPLLEECSASEGHLALSIHLFRHRYPEVGSALLIPTSRRKVLAFFWRTDWKPRSSSERIASSWPHRRWWLPAAGLEKLRFF
jgi:hypothetical protein